MPIDLRRTPLHAACLEAGARMIPFAGWEMPVQFSGLVQEHHAVRRKTGLFDISHMGVLRLEGAGVKDKFQKLLPTDLHRIASGEACYSILLDADGGILDDLIIYDCGKGVLLTVSNAACADDDKNWLRKHLEPHGIRISDGRGNGVLLALQGPDAASMLEQLSGTSLAGLPKFGHRQLTLFTRNLDSPINLFLSRTGYTGEDGFELLLATAEEGLATWQILMSNGAVPCGLGARDTLRLEAGMHLYGQDMNTGTNPFEAGLGRLVHLEMPIIFMGRQALEDQVEHEPKRQFVGLKVKDHAIARHGYPLLHRGTMIGSVTSGTWSPTLCQAVALGYVPYWLAKVGTNLDVGVRGRTYSATVVKLPFYRRKSTHRSSVVGNSPVNI